VLRLHSDVERLRVRYFGQPVVAPAPSTVLIAPDRVALLGLATRRNDQVDTILRVDEPAAVGAFHEFFFQMRTQTSPLVTVLPWDNQLLFDEELAAAGREDVRHVYLVRHDLSQVTVPPGWARVDSTWVRSRAARGLDARIVAAQLRQRLESVSAFATRRPFRVICTASAIDRWLESGQADRSTGDVAGFPVTPSERLERLENLIRMLEAYPHFELGLWDGPAESLAPAYFQVQGERGVLISGRRADGRGRARPVRLKVTQATVVAAFGLEFERLWTAIAPPRRSKAEIVVWLRGRIDQYRAQLGRASGVSRD
jgi:hypothetical protein